MKTISLAPNGTEYQLPDGELEACYAKVQSIKFKGKGLGCLNLKSKFVNRYSIFKE